MSAYRNGLDHTQIRRLQFDKGTPGVYGVIVVDTPAASIQILVSPTGRSVQIHADAEQVWKGRAS